MLFVGVNILAGLGVAKGQLREPDGRPIGKFLLADAKGVQQDLSQLKNKVMIVNFWSLTCVPCRVEMPTINTLAEHYAYDTDLQIFAVDLDKNLPGDIRYFDEKKFGLKIFTAAGVVPPELFGGVLPTTAVISKSGRVVYLRQEEGRYDSPEFYKLVDSLLHQ